MKKNPEPNPQKGQRNSALRYTTLGTQMIVLILLATWGGQKLDERAGGDSKTWTLVLILTAVFASLYFVLKEVIKSNRDE